jgi:hypothetical protein
LKGLLLRYPFTESYHVNHAIYLLIFVFSFQVNDGWSPSGVAGQRIYMSTCSISDLHICIAWIIVVSLWYLLCVLMYFLFFFFFPSRYCHIFFIYGYIRSSYNFSFLLLKSTSFSKFCIFFHRRFNFRASFKFLFRRDVSRVRGLRPWSFCSTDKNASGK